MPETRNARDTIATALQYSIGEHAPRVVARGKGHIAEEIIALAKRYNIDIVADRLLAESLIALEIEKEIPERLYGIVAEILAAIFAKREGP